MRKILLFACALLVVTSAQAKHGPKGKHRDDEAVRREVRRNRTYRPQAYPYYNNNLPPGLAKRNGNLPPGLRKHVDRTGQLPPGLEKRSGSTIVVPRRPLPPVRR